MKHEFISPTTQIRQTPLRLLIKQFPDLAKQVFDQCMSTNLQTSAVVNNTGNTKQRTTVSGDDPQFRITFNYELLDDTYTLCSSDESSLNSVISSSGSDQDKGTNPFNVSRWADGSIWDENNHLLPDSEAYADSSSILKVNHPLMIMVKEQRVVRCIL